MLVLVMKSILIFSSLFFLLSCDNSSGPDAPVAIGDSQNPPTRTTSPIVEDIITDEFLRLVNNYRQERGLPEVLLDVSMNEISRKHSQDMATSQVRFGHGGFSNRCAEARLALGGGNLCLENVARGQRNEQEVFNAWINSKGHRENIESSRVTHMGFGHALSTSGVHYWTQIFLER